MIGHQSTTKPSRINRKLKRRWKPVKIADLVNASLTDCYRVVNLCSLSQHRAARGESRKKHKMPIARLIHRLRFHMQKIIYGGRYLGGFGSHGSCAMSLNPDNVHRPIFERISGVLNISQEVNAMLQNNYAQNSEQTQPQDYDLTFFAVCNTAKIEGIPHTDSISPFFETREQALEFKASSLEKYPDCFIAKYVFEYSLESDPARLELLAKIVSGSFKPA